MIDATEDCLYVRVDVDVLQNAVSCGVAFWEIIRATHIIPDRLDGIF